MDNSKATNQLAPYDISAKRNSRQVTAAQLCGQVAGGMKMQIRRMPPLGPGRMQACMRLSLDSRLGKLAGTTTLPCLVVISIAPSESA